MEEEQRGVARVARLRPAAGRAGRGSSCRRANGRRPAGARRTWRRDTPPASFAARCPWRAESTARLRDDRRSHRIPRIRVQECDRVAVAREHRQIGDRRPRRQSRRRSARDRHLPHVTMIQVVLIGRIHDAASVGTEIGAEDLEVAGREQRRRAARRGDAVEVHPTRSLPREHDSVVGTPRERRVSFERIESAPCPGVGVPELVSLARRGVGDPDGPRLGGARR